MVVNPVRNPGRFALEVSADNSRNIAEAMYLVTEQRSNYPPPRLISNGVKRVKFAPAVLLAPLLLTKQTEGLRKAKMRGAVTLIEVMTTIVILTVAVLGASGYRYYAAMDARRAAMHRTAARIALSLCESWRGRGIAHTADYDPVAHLALELAISTSSIGPDVPADFTLLPTPGGRCKIVIDGVTYWATLSYKDDAATPNLRALNVVVGWKQVGPATKTTTFDSSTKLFKLTTYVSN